MDGSKKVENGMERRRKRKGPNLGEKRDGGGKKRCEALDGIFFSAL